jgi:hypothetical protein
MKEKFPTKRSALCELEYFGMVSGFPLESMHTMYLLVCKFFLEQMLVVLGRGWISGPKPGEKLKRKAILDSRIKMMQKMVPFEFDRKIETTDYMGTWKATTYRQFFLYLAYPLLEDLLDSDWRELLRYLQYFMYLVGGADPNPVPEADLDMAQKIMEYWVTKFIHLTNGVGAKPCTHFALHIVEDCRFHQCHYDVLSAFKYENCLRHILGDINSGNCKLEQLKNRMLEREKYVFNRDENGRIKRDPFGKLSMGKASQLTDLSSKHTNAQMVFQSSSDAMKCSLQFEEVKITNNLRDSFILINETDNLRRPQIMRVTKFSRSENDNLVAVGYIHQRKFDLFETPGKSTNKHVYAFSAAHAQIVTVPVSKIVGKLYVIPRFSVFGLKVADWEMLGEGFSKVDEWVGVALRHVLSAADKATLY